MEGEDLRTKKKLWVHGSCVGSLREYERGAPSTIDFMNILRSIWISCAYL